MPLSWTAGAPVLQSRGLGLSCLGEAGLRVGFGLLTVAGVTADVTVEAGALAARGTCEVSNLLLLALDCSIVGAGLHHHALA